MKNILVKWIRYRPIFCIIFSVILSSLATALAFREDWLLPGVMIYLGLALYIGIVICKDFPKLLLVLAIIFCLSFPQMGHAQQIEQDQPEVQAAGCAAAAVGVVVVCVGGYCVYKLVKFCQKHFPKTPPPTNAPPNITNTIPSNASLSTQSSQTYAVAWNFGEIGSCWDEDPCAQLFSLSSSFSSNQHVTMVLKVNLREDEDGNIVISFSGLASNKPQANQNWTEFQNEMLSYGVFISGHADGSSFSVNNQPALQADTPFIIDSERKLVKINFRSAPAYVVIVERSKDLKYWVELLRTEVEIDSNLIIEDTTSLGQQFYRFKAFLAD